MDLGVVALALGTIFVVELPDKTFIATLLLSTRYRPLLVWLGVGLAFGVQTGIAVGLGSVAGLLPETVVRVAAMLLFLAGSVLLFREARSEDPALEPAGDEAADSRSDPGSDPGSVSTQAHGVGAVVASFTVLFAAEWGDLSQLLTLSLVARSDAPGSVFAGAWGALLAVSGLAVLAGKALQQRVPVRALHAAGGVVCLALAGVTAYELLA